MMFKFHARVVIALTLLLTLVVSSPAVEIKRIRDSRGSVVAVRVSNADLVHTSQLIPDNVGESVAEQADVLLVKLQKLLNDHGAERSDLVKVNVYVRDAETRRKFGARVDEWSGDDDAAVAYVVSPAPNSTGALCLDAVFASEIKSPSKKAGDTTTSMLPKGDVVYISGQAAAGELREATRETMTELVKTVEHLGLTKRDVVQVKTFINPISEVDVANEEIAKVLGKTTTPTIVHVEWKSTSRPIEIEMIVAAPATKTNETVSYITPPWMKSSPVFSRVARIHGNDRIYIAGLESLKAGDGASQVTSVYDQLASALKASGSDLKHLAKATYYVCDDDASSQLNALRPKYYDAERPPAASKAVVAGVGVEDRGISIDMIAAPARTTDAKVRVIKDVSFLGEGRSEKLDLYLPPGEAKGQRPAIVIVHGGGWHGGDKAAAREKNIGNTLAKAGYVCASVNYELGKKTDDMADRLRSIWPRNLHDCKTAVRYLRHHADEYSIDKEHVGAIGGSAGGHLVAMLATTDADDGFDASGLYREQSSRVQAVVPMYGVHDIVVLARKRENKMNDADVQICRDASPVTYITADDPPALILHGTKDNLVPVEQSEILHKHWQAAKLSSHLVVMEGAPHSFHLQPKQRDLRELVIGFFDKHLKKQSR